MNKYICTLWLLALSLDSAMMIAYADENIKAPAIVDVQFAGRQAAIIDAVGTVKFWPIADRHQSFIENRERQLSLGYQQLIGSDLGWAALMEDGSVITWSSERNFAIPLAVRDRLEQGVQMIAASETLFFAIDKTGALFAWGDSHALTYFSEVKEKLKKGVVKVVGLEQAGAALIDDGSVVVWGKYEKSNPSRKKRWRDEQLSSGVVDIEQVNNYFVAHKAGGEQIIWGEAGGIASVFSNGSQYRPRASTGHNNKYTVLLEDGTVRELSDIDSWSEPDGLPSVNNHDIVQLVDSGFARTVLRKDGSVSSWGRFWGQPVETMNAVASRLVRNVRALFVIEGGVAALKHDGSVISWGHYIDPQDPVLERLVDVVEIGTYGKSFTARTKDGRLIEWGNLTEHRRVPAPQVDNAIALFGTEKIQGALLDDGSVTFWGTKIGHGIPGSDLFDEEDTAPAFERWAKALSERIEGPRNLDLEKAVFLSPQPLQEPDLLTLKVDVETAARATGLLAHSDGFVATLDNGELLAWGGINVVELQALLDMGVRRFLPTKEERLLIWLNLKNELKVWNGYKLLEIAEQERYQNFFDDPTVEFHPNSLGFNAINSRGQMIGWPFNVPRDTTLKRRVERLLRRNAKTFIGSNALLMNNGTLWYWGEGKLVALSGEYRLTKVYRNRSLIFALTDSGRVVDLSLRPNAAFKQVESLLQQGVKQLFVNKKGNSSFNAFAALKQDGTVISWFIDDWKRDELIAPDKRMQDIVEIYPHQRGFAAKDSSGRYWFWGNKELIPPKWFEQKPLGGIVQLEQTPNDFVALTASGTAAAWGVGSPVWIIGTDRDKRAPKGPIEGVSQLETRGEYIFISFRDGERQIFHRYNPLPEYHKEINWTHWAHSNFAYAALQEDGSVIAWGKMSEGGIAPSSLGCFELCQ